VAVPPPRHPMAESMTREQEGSVWPSGCISFETFSTVRGGVMTYVRGALLRQRRVGDRFEDPRMLRARLRKAK
jgi:hypothetical protein